MVLLWSSDERFQLNIISTFLIMNTIDQLYHQMLVAQRSCYWWLVESHLSGLLYLFVPKFWEVGRDPGMLFSHWANGCWVVGTIRGCGDTQILSVVIKFIWTFALRGGWDPQIFFSRLLEPLRATWWNFHLIFCIGVSCDNFALIFNLSSFWLFQVNWPVL